MSDDLDAYRTAKQKGSADSYLDSLGRPKALEAAPQFVALANRALELVPAAHDGRRAIGHRKRNENWQPGLFDATGGLTDLIRQTAFEEYEIDGVLYSRDQLLRDLSLIRRAKDIRRSEGENWQRRSTVATNEAAMAMKDTGIFQVIELRLLGIADAAE
jgi:hypothetical protein